MFMKHYVVPNICEPSIEFQGGGGDQGRCERRSEVFVKIQINIFFFHLFFFFGGGGGVGLGGGVRMDVNEELKFFVKIQFFFFFFFFFFFGGGGRVGGSG